MYRIFCVNAVLSHLAAIRQVLMSGQMERGNRYRYILKVKNEEERDSWVSLLQEECSRFLPLHDFFAKLRNPKEIGERPLGKTSKKQKCLSLSMIVRIVYVLFRSVVECSHDPMPRYARQNSNPKTVSRGLDEKEV